MERVNRQWSGSLHIGLTTLSVNDNMPHSVLPANALQMRSKPSWIMSGSQITRCGVTLINNYAPSLHRLDVSIFLNFISLRHLIVIEMFIEYGEQARYEL